MATAKGREAAASAAGAVLRRGAPQVDPQSGPLLPGNSANYEQLTVASRLLAAAEERIAAKQSRLRSRPHHHRPLPGGGE